MLKFNKPHSTTLLKTPHECHLPDVSADKGSGICCFLCPMNCACVYTLYKFLFKMSVVHVLQCLFYKDRNNIINDNRLKFGAHFKYFKSYTCLSGHKVEINVCQPLTSTLLMCK